MDGPYIEHQYCITYDGKDPERTDYPPLYAETADQAFELAKAFSEQEKLSIENFQIFYRIEVTARSTWTDVNEDEDYRLVLEKILDV